MFKNELALYVYPWENRSSNELVTAENFKVSKHLEHLYQYFRGNGKIHSIPCGDASLLKYTGRDVQRMIASGDAKWKTLVPEQAYHSAKHTLL